MHMGIGALSRRASCNIETIRYYECIGMLPAPPRTAGDHRVYDREHLKRLGFIRGARELGFTLPRVRELLRLVDGPDGTCEDVKEIALSHLIEVRRKIADLHRIESVLAATADRCAGGEVPDCPLVDALFAGSSDAQEA
jgi:MerR family mercuric resistance operon transcriptional regulator